MFRDLHDNGLVIFCSRHPGLVFAAIFVPFFLIANVVLAAIGMPKRPHDIALVIRNILVGTVFLELAFALYRRIERRDVKRS